MFNPVSVLSRPPVFSTKSGLSSIDCEQRKSDKLERSCRLRSKVQCGNVICLSMWESICSSVGMMDGCGGSFCSTRTHWHERQIKQKHASRNKLKCPIDGCVCVCGTRTAKKSGGIIPKRKEEERKTDYDGRTRRKE